MTKNMIAALGIALFAMSPGAFAQSSGDSDNQDATAAPAAGGAAGADNSQVYAHAALAGVTAAALIGAAFAVAGSGDSNVDLGGTGTTGTPGTGPATGTPGTPGGGGGASGTPGT